MAATAAKVAAQEAEIKAALQGAKTEQQYQGAYKKLLALAEESAEIHIPGLGDRDVTLKARRDHLRQIKIELERLSDLRIKGAPVGGRIIELQDERDLLVASIRRREDQHLTAIDTPRG